MSEETNAAVPTVDQPHVQRETLPWGINIPGHPRRSDSATYVRSRRRMVDIAEAIEGMFYGSAPYQDHHGGGLWLKDDDGWFLVRNMAGMEWSSQFCADPAKVDALRRNARRLYAAFPAAVEELGIRELLDTPITDADGVARWTDGICNASVPLPADVHIGVLPRAGGVHHYPGPITDIAFIKYDDFELWVSDDEGQPAAVTPVDRRGSGNGAVKVVYATSGSELGKAKLAAAQAGQPLVLDADQPIAKRAFAQQASAPTRSAAELRRDAPTNAGG